MDAQKVRMKAFADYNDYEIAGTYEDAGKSGKSIKLKLPIIEEDKEMSLDDDKHVEAVALLAKK